MKHAVSRQLFSYWSHLRGGRAAPERQDIDPAAIRTALADTFVLEVGGRLRAPVYSLRLSGTRLNALFLTELKGCPLLSLWSGADRDCVADLVGAVVDDCSPAVAGLRAGPAGYKPIDLEMILLPLKHHGRTHARVLGAITPCEIPSWLGLVPVEHLSVGSFRHLGPDMPVDPREIASELLLPTDDTSTRRYGRFVVHEGGRPALSLSE